MAITLPEPWPLEGVKNRSKVLLRMHCTIWRNTRREHPQTHHVALCWKRLSRSLEIKTDELAKNEATARAAKWCIDSCQAVIRYRTDPKETPRARRDESGAVVPDAICTFEYEVEW